MILTRHKSTLQRPESTSGLEKPQNIRPRNCSLTLKWAQPRFFCLDPLAVTQPGVSTGCPVRECLNP